MVFRATFISIVLIILHIWNEPYYIEYLKDRSVAPISCDDFKYGCCEVYMDCSFNDSSSMMNVNTTYVIDWRANIRMNERGSNCDRIKDIVVKYNTYNNKGLSVPELFEGVASCSKDSYPIEDCCSVDYNCDLRYNYDFMTYGGLNISDPLMGYSNYKEYFYSTYGRVVVYPSFNSYYWHMGKCPSFQEIISVYEEQLIKDNSVSPSINIIYTILVLVYLYYSLYLSNRLNM